MNLEQLVWTSASHTLVGGSGQAPVQASSDFPIALGDEVLARLCGPPQAEGTARALGEPRDAGWDSATVVDEAARRVVLLKRSTGVDPRGRPGAYLTWMLVAPPGAVLPASEAVGLALRASSVVEWSADSTPRADLAPYLLPEPNSAPIVVRDEDEAAVAVLLTGLLRAWAGRGRSLFVVPRHPRSVWRTYVALRCLPASIDATATAATQHPYPFQTSASVVLSDPAISAAPESGAGVWHLSRLGDLDPADVDDQLATVARQLVLHARDRGSRAPVEPRSVDELVAWAQVQASARRPVRELSDDELVQQLVADGRGAWLNQLTTQSELVSRTRSIPFVDRWLAHPVDLPAPVLALVRTTARADIAAALRAGEEADLAVRVHTAVGGRPDELDEVVLELAAEVSPDTPLPPSLAGRLPDAVRRNEHRLTSRQLLASGRFPDLSTSLSDNSVELLVRAWLDGEQVSRTMVERLAGQRPALVVPLVVERITTDAEPEGRFRDAVDRAPALRAPLVDALVGTDVLPLDVEVAETLARPQSVAADSVLERVARSARLDVGQLVALSRLARASGLEERPVPAHVAEPLDVVPAPAAPPMRGWQRVRLGVADVLPVATLGALVLATWLGGLPTAAVAGVGAVATVAASWFERRRRPCGAAQSHVPRLDGAGFAGPLSDRLHRGADGPQNHDAGGARG